MEATPQTLWDYLQGRAVLDEREGGIGSSWDGRVVIEHGACGSCLGLHGAYIDKVEPEGVVMLLKSNVQRGYHMAILAPETKRDPGSPMGEETTPCVQVFAEVFGGQHYARVFCACLPPSHVEKRRMEKLGSLPVTFPKWKWGRAIDVPVVTI